MESEIPTNSLVTPLLTDLYQITMAYAYWKNGRHNDEAVFELFFRENPFKGEYTVFCGLDECLKFMNTFKFGASDLAYLKSMPALAECDPRFFDDYLATLDCGSMRLYAMAEGTLAFPRVPLLTVVGPLGLGQLLETTLLNVVNFPSLVATNASRIVGAVRDGPACRPARTIELGLRRAQGPDGGFTASKYAMLGGCDGTSNVQAGKLLGVPVTGTNAHAYVMAHRSLDEVVDVAVTSRDGTREVLLAPAVLRYRHDLRWTRTNDGELASYISYAAAFPHHFLCISDTYDTLESGVRNFILVALVLDDLGYTPKGIRLDSGDLANLSLETAALFTAMESRFDRPFFKDLDIVASNGLNETSIHELNKKGHAITVFGVGTNLVTCQEQPALGCVYKLVELGGTPRMKLSNDLEKVCIPGRKIPYRLFGERGWPLADLLTNRDDDGSPPAVGERVLCRDPFRSHERVAVVPSRVERLHELMFDGERGVVRPVPPLSESRQYVVDQIKAMRPEILRRVDPVRYKVAVSQNVFTFLHDMWQSETPVMELR